MFLNGLNIELSKPLVMGILNVTPDSFHDGGRYLSKEKIAERAKQICNEGASIIDIGAYSTRPGAEDISVEEELNRILPAIEIVRQTLDDFPISIDTFRSKVVNAIVQNLGNVIVNDISAGELDVDMPYLVGELKLPYICMHMRGTPQIMQQNTIYHDLVNEILEYFVEKIKAFRKIGIVDLITDPGFGFSKTVEQNFELLNKLEYLKLLEVPMLVGLSRKSMIWKTLKIEPSQALNGTTALNMIALQKGASILRVHDVKEAVETITLYNKLKIS